MRVGKVEEGDASVLGSGAVVAEVMVGNVEEGDPSVLGSAVVVAEVRVLIA